MASEKGSYKDGGPCQGRLHGVLHLLERTKVAGEETLNLDKQTRPSPQTLHLKPYTLDLKSQSQNPKPYAVGMKPSALIPIPGSRVRMQHGFFVGRGWIRFKFKV